MISHESLTALYEARGQTHPCLLPNRVREVVVRCAFEIGEAPRHSEEDSTPEVLLDRSATAIQELLENVGFFDNDELDSFPEWSEAHELSQEIYCCLNRKE